MVNICGQMFSFYCIPSSSYSKDDLSFWQFWKIINVTRILERHIGRVGMGLLRTRISSSHTCFWPTWLPPCRLHSIVRPGITMYHSSLFRVQWFGLRNKQFEPSIDRISGLRLEKKVVLPTKSCIEYQKLCTKWKIDFWRRWDTTSL